MVARSCVILLSNNGVFTVDEMSKGTLLFFPKYRPPILSKRCSIPKLTSLTSVSKIEGTYICFSLLNLALKILFKSDPVMESNLQSENILKNFITSRSYPKVFTHSLKLAC